MVKVTNVVGFQKLEEHRQAMEIEAKKNAARARANGKILGQ